MPPGRSTLQEYVSQYLIMLLICVATRLSFSNFCDLSMQMRRHANAPVNRRAGILPAGCSGFQPRFVCIVIVVTTAGRDARFTGRLEVLPYICGYVPCGPFRRGKNQRGWRQSKIANSGRANIHILRFVKLTEKFVCELDPGRARHSERAAAFPASFAPSGERD